MLENLANLFNFSAEVGAMTGQSPQTAFAAILCVIMFVLFS
ncbi:YshB family small membrane protein [Budviciaceae bacterium CWB-B4]|uniref:YshB family small membrane protein n=1 Tax=Limnobaculum xujianqingii TaxID=2738837 RepID=A0A9D7ALF3_9GAMM|nr:YshB family small membrane protein [Limnobaculum xujianqingii]MBK5074794.1 YshB family small membrane protein [Limnobaculum xujianqingii]MBK5178104.1 YshB family small membrane protein [Limnobaculum xujianqingii]